MLRPGSHEGGGSDIDTSDELRMRRSGRHKHSSPKRLTAGFHGRWRSSLVMRGLGHSIRSGLAAARGDGEQSGQRSHCFRGTLVLTTTQEPTYVAIIRGGTRGSG